MRLALLALLVLFVPSATAADLRVTLEPGKAPHVAATGVVPILLVHEPGERLVWNLTSGKPQLDVVVHSLGYFDVKRPRQVYPEYDPRYDFYETSADRFSVTPGARSVNYTSVPGNLTIRLTFPLSGSTNLTLARDVRPPGFTVGAVRNVTHRSFYVETTTDEYAQADLQVRPAAGGEEVRNPTPTRSFFQRFPVLGLDAATKYEFFVEFWDWSGNRARSDPVYVVTASAPDYPAPVVTAREPEDGANVPGPVARIALDFTGPQPPGLDHVNVFVDKRPVVAGLTLLTGRLEAALSPALGRGAHSVTVELRTAEGGTRSESWSFTVGGDGLPAPDAIVLVGLVAAAAFLRRRRA